MKCRWLLPLLLTGCLGEMDQQPRTDAWEHRANVPPAGTIPAGPPSIPPRYTLELLKRGQERYRIYCSPCHGITGDGHGEVVRRGFPAPPSFLEDRLRRAEDVQFYSAIMNGAGRMWAYADRVPEPDRWAIVGYIRALQLSQGIPAADVPSDISLPQEYRQR